MAYFKPLEYIPFAPSGPPLKRSGVEEDHTGWQWTESPEAFARRKAHVANTQYRDYSGQQLQSLFDSVNKLGAGLNTYTSGQAQEQQAAQAQQSELARQAFQASLPQAPQMNFQQSPQPIYTGGGWGQQSPMVSSAPMTYRGQSPSGMLGTTNRGSHGGILGGSE
jgi:hypothetical protein